MSQTNRQQMTRQPSKGRPVGQAQGAVQSTAAVKRKARLKTKPVIRRPMLKGR